MTIGSTWYFIWVMTWILPVTFENKSIFGAWIWVISLIAGLINGFGAGLLWVGQGKYVSSWSDESNKGLYFGLVWALFASNFVLANILGTLLISDSFSCIPSWFHKPN